MQPHALVRFPDDTYIEYFFDSAHGVYGNIPYPSTENLLSYGPSGYVEDEGSILLGGFSSDEVLPLNANYESWALTVGSDWDCIFYGHNAEGNVLIHGNQNPFRCSNGTRFLDVSNIAQGLFVTDSNRGFTKKYDQIVDSYWWRSVAPSLINLGALPNLPPDTPLNSIQTTDGWEYWRMIWS